MAKQWAIVIGINHYEHVESLRYAEQDAALVRDFLAKDAKFDQIYYFSDSSSEITLDGGATISTKPTGSNLRHFFEVRFATPFLKPNDSFWFFFIGHGLQYANGDYLLPCDAQPEIADSTAISIETITHCLRQSGATNIVLVLDACRTEEQKFGQGFGTDPKGAVTIFSSGFGELTREIEGLQQGAFTHALLEGLQDNEQNGTIEHLYHYLKERVPRLNLEYGVPPQVPRISADPSIPLNTITIPRAVTPQYKKRLNPVRQRLETPASEAAVNVSTYAPGRESRKTFWAELAGLITVVGVLGYVAYQTWHPLPVATPLARFNTPAINNLAISPTPKNASPTDRALPSPSSLNTSKSSTQITPSTTPTQPPDTPPADTAESDWGNDIYQRLPRTGTYYATSSLLASSRREISRGNDRLCIRIIDGPIAPSTGPLQILVSSLSVRKDGVHVDATYEKLNVDSTYSEFTDSKGAWQLLDRKVDASGLMAECIASRKSYVRQIQAETGRSSS